MKVVQLEWAEFLREFDRQSAAEEKEEPLCPCFSSVGEAAECKAKDCESCKRGHPHFFGPQGSPCSVHIVPAVPDDEPTSSKTLRLNGSHTQFLDKQYPTTSSEVKEQMVGRQRTKRMRETEETMNIRYAHVNGEQLPNYYNDCKRELKNSEQQTEIDTPVVDARTTRAVNGKGREKGSFSPETIDLTTEEDVVVIDTQHITSRKTKRIRSPNKTRTGEIGMYEEQMEEKEPKKNSKKRNAQKAMSPFSEQKRFNHPRDEEQPGPSTNGHVSEHCEGPSTSSQKSPVRSPRYAHARNRERNGLGPWLPEDQRRREDSRNYTGTSASSQPRPSPTTTAEPFFQNAFHTKERWRRSSDVGGNGHSFEPVALTSPPQSFLSPRRELRHLIDPLMSPVGEEAERPKQNGKVNGQRDSFRNTRKPTEKATKPMGFHLYQTLVRHRRTSVGSDTLLTPPLPADETDSARLGPLALRPPDTFSLEDGVSVQAFLMSPGMNMVSPLGSPGLWSPKCPKAPSPIPPYSPLSIVIEKANGVSSPPREEPLLAMQRRVSPRKMNGVREHEVESEGALELLSETELMPHLDESGLPNIDAIMDFGGLTHENIHEEYRIKITVPRVIVTYHETMMDLLTEAVRRRFKEMYVKAKPLSKKDLRTKLDSTFKHTECIHGQLVIKWDERLKKLAENRDCNGFNASYRRQLNPLWRLLQNEQPLRVVRNHKHPQGYTLAPENMGMDQFNSHHSSEKEYLKRMGQQDVLMARWVDNARQKKAVDWERKDIMELEQMLPHVSTDRQHHEGEARRRFQPAPDSFRSIRDGAYWISSQKLHDMVTSAIRFRVERHKDNATTIYLMLKDWNELRIHYEDTYRLPRDVLVTLSPYRAIAPAVRKKPRDRFKTSLTGTLDLN